MLWPRRHAGDRRDDFLGEFRRPDDAGGLGILGDELVVLGGEQGVYRHRDEAGLDRAPEQERKGRAVFHHHEYPVARVQPEIDKRIARAVHIVAQLGIGRIALTGPDRDLVAAAFLHVTVNEGHSHVELVGECQTCRGGGIINSDSV